MCVHIVDIRANAYYCVHILKCTLAGDRNLHTTFCQKSSTALPDQFFLYNRAPTLVIFWYAAISINLYTPFSR